MLTTNRLPSMLRANGEHERAARIERDTERRLAESVLVRIGSATIAVDADGTARAMTIAEQRDWLDLMEATNRVEEVGYVAGGQ